MRRADLARLLALAALWGGSFMFMRVLAPHFGPVLTADVRVTVGGLVLLLWMRFAGLPAELRRYWRVYLWAGLLTSALPFFLYAFAAMSLPASLTVIINALSPMFGALFSALWLGERLRRLQALGMLLGVAGVTLIARPEDFGVLGQSPLFWPAVLASIGAAMSYGLAGVYVRKHAASTPPNAVAAWSQLFASLQLTPLLLVLPPPPPAGWAGITLQLAAIGLLFGLLCNALAYLFYFRLIRDLGPTRALTVTFLMPAFGVMWAVLLLGESLTPGMASGGAIILLGTWLVLRRG